MDSSENQPLGSNEIYQIYTPSIIARSTYFYIQYIGHFHRSSNYAICRKGWKDYLLLYTINGNGCLKYKEKSYNFSKNAVMLIELEEYHEYFATGAEEWEFKWFHFNGCGSQGYYNAICDKSGPVVYMNEDNNIEGQIDAIINLLTINDIQFEIKASGIIFQILTEILLSASMSQYNINLGNKDYYTRIENALEFIKNNYNDKIVLIDMAEAARISQFHFSRLFKRIIGYSPYEYLLNYRISKAKEFLRNSDLSIEDIAGRVGFESSSNFIKKFKELEGITPLKYHRYWMG